MAELFDNRADTIWKVLVRDHLVSSGILPNVNSVKLNRVAKLVTSVCSRTTRLKDNQVKSRKRDFKTEKSDDKGAAAIVKTVPQLGCVLARLRATRTSEKREVSGNPIQKVLGSIRRVRFTQSTVRQASIRENKGPSIAWENTSQNASPAKSLRNEM